MVFVIKFYFVCFNYNKFSTILRYYHIFKMNNKNILELNQKIFDLISTKDITFLKDVDTKINIIKNGQFKHFKLYGCDLDQVKNFLFNLDSNKIYTLIPFISINAKIEDPLIILSRQILISRNSDPTLLYNYVNDRLLFAQDQFEFDKLESFYTIFKYKYIEIDFNSYKKF